MNFWHLIRVGGVTLIILFICSIVSLAIIFERYIYYRMRSRVKRVDFMAQIRQLLENKNLKKALELCENTNTPFSNVVYSGVSFHGHDERVVSNNMEREIVSETTVLEKHTSIVGTIGSVAIYIGLFGTVLGIIRAFHDISSSKVGGINVVINGISEALICTAAGLCVSVPAVVAYNYFMTRVNYFIRDMELCASETMDILTSKTK